VLSPVDPSIVVIASLDTKGEEAGFIRDQLEATGQRILVMDVGVLADPQFEPDIANSVVAAKGGESLALIRSGHDRARAIDVMSKGAEVIVCELHRDGKLLGIMGIGGSGGTTIGTAAMRALPLGIPKVMVSTLVAGDLTTYARSSDICMMHSVIDFCGVNPLSEMILGNACAAISGMARAVRPSVRPASRKLIAASMFGVTTACVMEAAAFMREAGYELIPFHATGSGGRTMEELVGQGHFSGVLDFTTTEWADEVVGGSLSAGPSRLEAAAKAGLPQVIAPGALDMVNFVGPRGLPDRFRGRLTHTHSRDIILMRTSVDESREIGKRVAEKLNAARGPVTVMFPTRGVSALDLEGHPFYDLDADKALLEALRRNCRPPVEVEEVDFHINDPAFAHACCRRLLAAMDGTRDWSGYAEENPGSDRLS
jgi:uncharacterized protein (UPF0261 family)